MKSLVPLCLLSIFGTACAADESALVAEGTTERRDASPILIQSGTDQILLAATQANLFYLPSPDRREVVFASATAPDGPGLYLASARP